VGSPATIAAVMEDWLNAGACDGFMLALPYLPGGLTDFIAEVLPILRRRGLFRAAYEGKTLRENLGLPRPANRFAAQSAAAS
jgi:alkanesulfonate monooxygenase